MIALWLACAASVEEPREDPAPGVPSPGWLAVPATPADTADSVRVEVCEHSAPEAHSVEIDAACVDGPEKLDLRFREVFSQRQGRYSASAFAVTRLHDADGDGDVDVLDPMQIVGFTSSGAHIYDHDGVLERGIALDAYRLYGSTGDVDSSDPGAELLLGWYVHSGGKILSVHGPDTLWTVEVEDAGRPILTDIEGGGLPELAYAGFLLDSDGEEKVLLDVDDVDDVDIVQFHADLDLDGTSETIALLDEQREAVLFEPDGSRRATCHERHNSWQIGGVAIGNLDDDDEGEVILAGEDRVMICDADGSKLRVAAIQQDSAPWVGVGQLDDDPEPEILLAGSGDILALSRELEPMWRHSGDCMGGFALADLDRDGRHEVVVAGCDEITVLSGDGEVLGGFLAGLSGWSSQYQQPAIVDVDGDGLAEIVQSGGSLTVIDNPRGGWSLPGADEVWPGRHKRPGDQGPTGQVGSGSWWLEHNVYNGLPAGPAPGLDLDLALHDVCEDANGQWVTLRLANRSPRPHPGGVTVTLTRDDEPLATWTVEDLLAGTVVYEQVLVPPGDGTLVATLDTPMALSECGHAHEDAG